METSVLNPSDAVRVVERYRQRIAQYGLSLESLNSGSRAKQSIRCQVHQSALRNENPSILDIGCGLGFLLEFLNQNHVSCQYTGYDIVPEYVLECRRLYPQSQFELRNIFSEGIEGTYDTVVMSQVLNNRYRETDNIVVMQRALALAYEHSRISVSVDMLSSHVDFQLPELFYYSPEEMFRFAKTLARRVIVRHDYRPFEFCLQLLHDGVPGFVP